MEYQELKNFGQLYTPKASARVLMASFTNIPKELGFLGTPKFVAKLGSKNRYWNRRRLKTAEERGVTHAEFMEGIRYSLAFYTAIVATCGAQKTREVYPKLAQRLSLMMWEDYLPPTEDFLRFESPWEALREYVLEYYRTNEREGVWRYEVIRDTDSEFQVHVTDCAWAAMHEEGGCLDGFATSSSYSEGIVFSRLAQAIGGDFKQEDGCLCHRDPICDWHFFRHKVPESD